MKGMDRALAAKLSDGGVKDLDSLAELAVDELIEMTGVEDARARELIMTAREHWFVDEAPAATK
jgi:transcription termination/antitermination protein NusA